MVTRSARSRVVGALSIIYGIVLGLFWTWNLWTNLRTQDRTQSWNTAMMILLAVAAPVLLLFAGASLSSSRIGEPDARALKVTAVIVLTVKAIVIGYWAIDLIMTKGALGRIFLPPLGWGALEFEAVPSAIWALVLGFTPIEFSDPRLKTRSQS